MLADYINLSTDYRVLFTANNGMNLLEQLNKEKEKPSIILLDIHMPIMDGFQTMLKLKEYYPDIMVVILSMEDEEYSIIQFLHLGAKGYLLKGMPSPEILIECFDEVMTKGFYYPNYITKEMLSTGRQLEMKEQWTLTDRKLEFLKLVTQTSMTYKEIADEMYLSIKTIENYQSVLFKQFGVKNRPALMLLVRKYNIIGFNKY